MNDIMAMLIIVASVLLVSVLTAAAALGAIRGRVGYGTRALEGFETDREISVTVVELPVWSGGWDEGSVSDAKYTLITMPHKAKLPWVVEVLDGEARRHDKKRFVEWASEKRDPRQTPEEIRLPRGSGFETVAENVVRRELDLNDIFQIRGVARIEPAQVHYVERGDLLDPAYLRTVTGVLLRLADEAEKVGAGA